jgi:cyanate permease
MWRHPLVWCFAASLATWAVLGMVAVLYWWPVVLLPPATVMVVCGWELVDRRSW